MKFSFSLEEEGNKGQGCYVVVALSALVFVLIWEWLWPNVIPFTLVEFWNLRGSWVDVLKTSWPILLWAVIVSIVTSACTRNDPEENDLAEKNLFVGGLMSLFAGIFEEISFRWFIFYGQIIAYKVANFLFFGWLGFGVAEWLYLHLEGPIVNFITFGKMSHLLFSDFGWFVGAAMVTSNGKFRDGHAYQGCFGWLNSWVIGMVLFYIMFKHGLLASMVTHFVYDIIIFTVHYIDSVIERSCK